MPRSAHRRRNKFCPYRANAACTLAARKGWCGIPHFASILSYHIRNVNLFPLFGGRRLDHRRRQAGSRLVEYVLSKPTLHSLEEVRMLLRQVIPVVNEVQHGKLLKALILIYMDYYLPLLLHHYLQHSSCKYLTTSGCLPSIA
jgi:hypothetical protein